MTRTQWALTVVGAVPVLVGATVVSATLGPYGAAGYGLLLIGGINSRHLFRRTSAPDLVHRVLYRLSTSKGRHR